MDIYKIKSLELVFIIYIIAILPSFAISLIKQSSKNTRLFIKSLCICTIIETIIFSIIYLFPRNIVSIFPVSKNIENYSIYSLKILFIASILTPIHLMLPIYLLKNKKKKKALILFSLKIIYIPIFIIMNLFLGTQIALFTIPLLDIIYTAFLILNIIRNYI